MEIKWGLNGGLTDWLTDSLTSAHLVQPRLFVVTCVNETDCVVFVALECQWGPHCSQSGTWRFKLWFLSKSFCSRDDYICLPHNCSQNTSRTKTDSAAWGLLLHVHVRDNQIAAIAVADQEYPSRAAFSVLSSLLDDYESQAGHHSGTSRKWNAVM